MHHVHIENPSTLETVHSSVWERQIKLLLLRSVPAGTGSPGLRRPSIAHNALSKRSNRTQKAHKATWYCRAPPGAMCSLQHRGFVGDVTALQLCSLWDTDGESQVEYVAAGIKRVSAVVIGRERIADVSNRRHGSPVVGIPTFDRSSCERRNHVFRWRAHTRHSCN